MMTETQKEITTLLHTADAHLRSAMILAGAKKMVLVTNDIRDAEFFLDDALAHVKSYAKAGSKKKSKKNLTSSHKCVRM